MQCADFRPQEKLVFESENIRSALDRMQRYEPRRKLFFDASTRRWRFYDITSAPQITVTLNDATADFPVLSMQLRASMDDCCSAVHIFGPPTTQTWEFYWFEDPEAELPEGDNIAWLWPVGESQLVQSYTDSSGMQEARTWNQWRVADPAKRRGARALPDWYQSRVSDYQWIPTKMAMLLFSFDSGETWISAQNVWFDNLNGLATLNGTVPFIERKNSSGGSLIPGSTQTLFVPNAVKMVWAPFVNTISVRVPAEGHEGTWTALTGKTYELCQYDESLAVGYEFGTPVTTSTRLAQFEHYARSILDWRKDISWSGAIVLDGIDTRWAKLNKRLNIAASNGSGGTTTTGWEAINAFVTDVEYDFEEQLTTVTFSSDRLEQLGEDPAQLKERLKIRALEQRQTFALTYQLSTFVNYYGLNVNFVTGIMNTMDFEYIDTVSGEVQR